LRRAAGKYKKRKNIQARSAGNAYHNRLLSPTGICHAPPAFQARQLYSLLPHVRHLPQRWRWLLGFLLTDETFAVVDSYYRQHPHAPQGHWYFLGSGLAMYLNWQCWTLIGLVFGAAFPQLQTLGLDFAMVVTFIAIVVPQLNRLPNFAAAVAAGSFAYLLKDLPYKLGLLVAILVGVGIGMLLTQLRTRVSTEQHIA
jgi:predicted branched-subunit amino acid permease